jgi:hypothetical protein
MVLIKGEQLARALVLQYSLWYMKAETSAFREALSHPAHIHHTYVVFGEEGEYFKNLFNDRTGLSSAGNP